MDLERVTFHSFRWVRRKMMERWEVRAVSTPLRGLHTFKAKIDLARTNQFKPLRYQVGIHAPFSAVCLKRLSPARLEQEFPC